MKKIQMFLVFLCLGCFLSTGYCQYTITGHLKYDNDGSYTAMGNDNVYLKDNSGAIIETTITANDGLYRFSDEPNGGDGYPNGVYKVGFYSTTKPWGGGNGADALLIQQHFIGTITLTGIFLTAADVDASGFVNTNDAASVMQRFVGLILSFPSGDWVINEYTVTINNNHATQEIITVCYGDVDGSYIP